MSNLWWNDLNSRLDWSKVTEAVSEHTLESIEEVTEAVERAARRYLEYDYKRLDHVEGVEHLIEVEGPSERRSYKGFIDLWGWNDRRAQIVDWKYPRTLDERWKWREERSSQAKWYAMLLLAAGVWGSVNEESVVVEVEFRGVKNPSGDLHKVARQTVHLGDLIQYETDLQGWESSFANLAQDWSWPWPKNQPEGCRPFGDMYPCIHEDTCEGRRAGPKYDGMIDKKLSYSTLKEFRRCPERVRLNVLTGLTDPSPVEKSEASEEGNAFHAGIAEVYRQTFGLKETT